MTQSDSQTRGELELVRRLRSILAPPAGRTAWTAAGPPPLVDFGDDMSPLSSPGGPLLWSTDMLMDGVDFDSRVHTWPAIGRKAMAVNLSDCAAMAAVPISALCAVSLANTLSMEDALALLQAAHQFGLRFDCPIVGGDTNSWDAPTVISICVAARCQPDCGPVRRDGARPGDTIWLTGRVGGSLLGRHMTFEPRVTAALEIARQLGPHAMIDISDGLALDLGRVLEASGCGAILEEACLDAAIHPDAHRFPRQDHKSPRDHALHDGEDFELIVVLPPQAPRQECERLKLLPLGRMIAGQGLLLETANGVRQPIPVCGWEHFR
jgi:thiamine-monophosphate kinase